MESNEKSLSKQRLEKYLKSNVFNIEEALQNYRFNIEISEALYPSLHILEVTLRNHINDSLTNTYGNNWLTPTFSEFRDSEKGKLIKILSSLKQRKKELNNNNVIPELTFGFWVSRFDREYENKKFWSKTISTMFPHMPRTPEKISLIRKKLNLIRILRNRVYHYEPIWKSHDLKNKYEAIHEVIGWINTDMIKYLKKIDRFEQLYHKSFII